MPFLWLSLCVLILVIIAVVVYRIIITVESFAIPIPPGGFGGGVGAAASGAGAGGVPAPDMTALITEKVNIVLTPVVSIFNNVIDTLNTTSAAVYTDAIGMSSSIGTKIKEYAESMKGYSRTDDNKSISVNKDHLEFLDNMQKSNDPLFGVFATEAEMFYKVPFESQNDVLLEILQRLGKYYSKIPPLLAVRATPQA